MDKDRLIDNEIETAVDSNEEYIPRNSIVAAKENLYDKANISVGQVDKFIGFCIAAIVIIIMLGLNM